jgi:hypothetical protein
MFVETKLIEEIEYLGTKVPRVNRGLFREEESDMNDTHFPRQLPTNPIRQTPERGGAHVSQCPLFCGGWGDTHQDTQAHALWCGNEGQIELCAADDALNF